MATKSSKKQDSDELTAVSPVGTAMFAHVHEPYKFKDSDKKASYRLILVFDRDTNLKALKRIVLAAAKKKWGDRGERMVKDGKISLPFRDGDEYEQYGDPFNEDHVFISASSNSPPGVVDSRREPIEDQFDFYSGCKARMSVYAHAFDSNGNKGVTFLLNNVQKCGDGERISGRKNAEDEFEDYGDDEDDDDAPRRSKKRARDDDDDEDDTPRRSKKTKRSRDDDDEDDDDLYG